MSEEKLVQIETTLARHEKELVAIRAILVEITTIVPLSGIASFIQKIASTASVVTNYLIRKDIMSEERQTEIEAILARHEEEIKVLRKNVAKLIPPSEFDHLKSLLESDQWPAAVDPALICDITSEQDKQDRAEGIIELIIDTYLDNLAFLDFGCGEGHVVNHSRKQKPIKMVGYDIVNSPRWESWEKADNLFFTDQWEEVKKQGPYNVILMYDVLDHIKGEDAELIEILKRVKEVLIPGGKLYFRGHPWCSRHATHLYHTLNKAFAHLVFTEEELLSMGYKPEYVRQLIHPIKTYNDLFHAAGFNILRKEHISREDVEGFFSDTLLVAQRIKAQWKNSHEDSLRSGKNFPKAQVSMVFIDYILN